jgi:hypothetical protein
MFLFSTERKKCLTYQGVKQRAWRRCMALLSGSLICRVRPCTVSTCKPTPLQKPGYILLLIGGGRLVPIRLPGRKDDCYFSVNCTTAMVSVNTSGTGTGATCAMAPGPVGPGGIPHRTLFLSFECVVRDHEGTTRPRFGLNIARSAAEGKS